MVYSVNANSLIDLLGMWFHKELCYLVRSHELSYELSFKLFLAYQAKACAKMHIDVKLKKKGNIKRAHEKHVTIKLSSYAKIFEILMVVELNSQLPIKWETLCKTAFPIRGHHVINIYRRIFTANIIFHFLFSCLSTIQTHIALIFCLITKKKKKNDWDCLFSFVSLMRNFIAFQIHINIFIRII